MGLQRPHLIDALVSDLKPIRPLSLRDGLLITTMATILDLVIVAMVFGIRHDVLVGNLDPLFLLSSGLFLVLGFASASTVIAMSRPQVGSDHDGWVWAAATAALLPLSALLLALVQWPLAPPVTDAEHGIECLLVGVALGSLVAVALTLWLRRGAPTSPERAGLLTGIAAGCFGIFAFAFHCPNDSLFHVGLWHALPIPVSAVIGRFVVPRLIRW